MDRRGEVVGAMTRDQQIGQLFAVGFYGTTPTPDLIDLIQRDFVGAVILFSRNIRSREQTAELTHTLQEAARAAGHPYPLLIMTDQENGLVGRLGPDSLALPGNMALGAIPDPDGEELVYKVACATARELQAHGINMNLAPVVDVNSNPDNPVIGVRSFGEHAEMVARLGAAAVRGYHDAGIVSTLKHFPGHGDTAVDSHRALPVVAADLARLEAVELVPFRAGIAAGAPCVMTAHVALPALTVGEALPATLEAPIVSGLLRERLGFDGLVISDCLEMNAITRHVGAARGSVLALQAGVDLLLISHRLDRQRASLDAVRTAVTSGEAPSSRVREAAGRVLLLKRRYLAETPAQRAAALLPCDVARHQALQQSAYGRSTTVLRDDGDVLPLRLDPAADLLVIDYVRDPMNLAVDHPMTDSPLLEVLRHHHEPLRSMRLASQATGEQIETVVAAARLAGAVLVVTGNLHRDKGQESVMREIVRRLVAMERPVIGIAVCDPYDAAALPQIGTFLATYEPTPPALESAARVIFGAAPALGRCPVSLAPHLE
jgi:beta-N-acetylhexosaminidase